MSSAQHHVIIKGIKDGLVFILDDRCAFEELMIELQHKLEKTHQNILTGPLIHVNVKMGQREVTEKQKESIRNLLKTRGNLVIQSIEAQTIKTIQPDPWKVIKGMVRSGQTIQHEQSLLYIGDVNPGGTIISFGDIYIMGSLRGMAHAGAGGNQEAVIAASYLQPTQLRIADVISRPPDEWGIQEAVMEFAYLQDGKMEIDKINQLHRIRSESIGY